MEGVNTIRALAISEPPRLTLKHLVKFILRDYKRTTCGQWMLLSLK